MTDYYLYHIFRLDCVFTARRFILLIIIVAGLLISAQAAKVYGAVIILVLLTCILFIAIIVYLLANKKIMKPVILETDEIPSEPSENTAKPLENRTSDLPDDLRELYDLIMIKGGRTTQKEIRKDAKYGEAKVSLMLADLEDRGLIKKIKKGRSNIIIAENIK